MRRFAPTRKRILINVTPFEKRIAILEENHLAEIFYEPSDSGVQVGSIYKGVVNAVLTGLQAAFVDLGEEKAGFLHVEDAVDRDARLRLEYGEDDENGRGGAEKPQTIDSLLKVGQELLVQVTKEPMGTKGARLTTHLTLADRFLVCMPGTDFVGVSKRSRDLNRRRQLKRAIKNLKQPGVGYIVRTLGLRESEEEFAKQIEILQGKWDLCSRAAENAQAPCLVYKETNFSQTTLRDYFSQNVDQLVVDEESEYRAVVDYLSALSPDMLDRVSLYDGDIPLFDYFGLEEELEKTFESKVYLRRGGYIVIEQTEALVAIDVNTGGKVRGKDQGKNIVETNIDAAWEIAKQMRLRDLGGLIVLDFIDMEKEEDNQAVEAEFKKAIRQDKAPIHFNLISQFGLMELTRKRVRSNIVKNQSRICTTCQGNKYIPKKQSILAGIDRWLHRCHSKSKNRKLALVLHPQLVEEVLKDRARCFKYWEMKYGMKLELMEDERAPLVEFRVFNSENYEDLTPYYEASYSEESPSLVAEDE